VPPAASAARFRGCQTSLFSSRPIDEKHYIGRQKKEVCEALSPLSLLCAHAARILDPRWPPVRRTLSQSVLEPAAQRVRSVVLGAVGARDGADDVRASGRGEVVLRQDGPPGERQLFRRAEERLRGWCDGRGGMVACLTSRSLSACPFSRLSVHAIWARGCVLV